MGLAIKGAHVDMHAEAGITGPCRPLACAATIGSLWHRSESGEHGALAITQMYRSVEVILQKALLSNLQKALSAGAIQLLLMPVFWRRRIIRVSAQSRGSFLPEMEVLLPSAFQAASSASACRGQAVEEQAQAGMLEARDRTGAGNKVAAKCLLNWHGSLDRACSHKVEIVVRL